MSDDTKDYDIAVGETPSDLRRVVKTMMQEGWVPVGGLVPDVLYSFGSRYLQTMVRN